MKHFRTKNLLIAFGCVFSLQFACGEDATEPTSPEPKIYKIVFSWDIDNDEHNEIYTVKPDGTELTRLTNSPSTSSNGNPIWSPDGRYIYYKDFMDEANEIIRMNSDGTHKVNLTQYPGLDVLCDLSPDGKKLAFISDRDGGTHNIFVMDLDSMTTTNVTNGDQFEGRYVRFTRDGRQLLYSAGPSGSQDLCLEGIDGTGRTILSNLDYGDTQGIVSPDGGKIVYVSQHFNEDHNEVWVCAIDGNNRTKITESNHDKWEPMWSPNSQQVIFTEMLDMDTLCVNVVNADGSNRVCLSDSTTRDFFPRFSPDGAKILFVSGPAGTSELFVMNSDRSGRLQLTNNAGGGSVYYPAWSPGL